MAWLYTLFVTLAVTFFTATVILAIVVLESYSQHGRVIIAKWREAWSKRKEIDAALRKAQAAAQKAWDADKLREAAEINEQHAKTEADTRIARMGSFIIAEQCGDHIKAIKASNYHAKEKKILRSIEVAAKNGYHLPKDEREQLARMLKQAHEAALRAEEEKQRQALIREQIREEEQAQREYARAIKKAEEQQKRLEREAEIKRQALEEAIALLGDTHSEQIEQMKQKLAEAQAEAEEARLAAERTKSMAEQTRAGHIYIISNIGSFGENVFKVGMTRRQEPMDRVRELGDASVPFAFDVHAMISADDAPALEAGLHQDLSAYRVNRVNLRKEFFRTDLQTIIDRVRERHGEVTYQADPEALEYLESQAIASESASIEELIDQEAEEAEEATS